MLRAIVWRLTGSADRATRIAARTGMAFGFAVAHGHFEGVVTQSQVIQLLQLRAELR